MALLLSSLTPTRDSLVLPAPERGRFGLYLNDLDTQTGNNIEEEYATFPLRNISIILSAESRGHRVYCVFQCRAQFPSVRPRLKDVAPPSQACKCDRSVKSNRPLHPTPQPGNSFFMSILLCAFCSFPELGPRREPLPAIFLPSVQNQQASPLQQRLV